MQSLKVFAIICGVFGLLFGYILPSNPSYRWVDIRYTLIGSALFSILLTYYKDKFVIFCYTMTTVILCTLVIPTIFVDVKNIDVLGPMYWRELNFFLYYHVLILMISTILLYKNSYRLSICFMTIMQFILSIYPIIFLIYYFKFNDIIDVNSLIAIYQTTPSEAYEFIIGNFYIWSIILIFIILMIFIMGIMYLFKQMLSLNKDKLNVGAKRILCMSFIAVVIIAKPMNLSYIQVIVSESKEYLNQVKEYKAFRTHSPIAVTSLTGKKLFFVVIGESQNKRHMSAYGYGRETTPWLNKMRNNQDFIFMENAYAYHTLTVNALSAALTEKNQFNSKKFAQSYSLTDIAKASGFNIIWISNQPKYGGSNNPITAVAENANMAFWINENSFGSNAYDETLFKYLKNDFSNGLNIIFIHLNGSHHVYKERYPKKFNKFEGADGINLPVNSIDEVNEYDNSILYTDFVLQQIYNYATVNMDAAGIIYISDHGEDVDNQKRHVPGLFNFNMARIPFFIYLSPQYQKENKEIVDALHKNREKYFTNDLLYDTVLGILKIDTSHSQPEYSLTSDKYSIRKEELRILDGKISITE